MEFIEPDNPSDELAGFESYRQKLYASQAAVSLGLKLLPSLATENVYAEGSDLERLLGEAELALANIGLFEVELGASAESLRPRFENIICAIHRASRLGGGVVIW
jgi:HEPN domain-containing protein